MTLLCHIARNQSYADFELLCVRFKAAINYLQRAGILMIQLFLPGVSLRLGPVELPIARFNVFMSKLRQNEIYTSKYHA